MALPVTIVDSVTYDAADIVFFDNGGGMYRSATTTQTRYEWFDDAASAESFAASLYGASVAAIGTVKTTAIAERANDGGKYRVRTVREELGAWTYFFI